MAFALRPHCLPNVMTSSTLSEATSNTAPRSRVPGLLFLLLLVWLLTTAAYKAATSAGAGITGIDFTIFYHAAQRVARHQPLYQPHGELYAYSPLFALALRPLALLPLGEALKVWFVFSALCLVGAVAVYASAARMTTRDGALIGLLLLTAFRCWPTTMNFALGQANFLLLLLLCGMYWADSRGRMALFATLLAVAALVKIWMLGFVVYLVVRRLWRDAALCAGLFLGVMAVLFTVVGWREFGPFVQAGILTGRQVVRVSVTHSLYGFALLHLHANPIMPPLIQSKAVFYGVLALGTAAVLAGWVLLWRQSAPPRVPEARAALSLVSVSVLLLLPPCQNEYLVMALPALWTLLTLPKTSARRAAPLWTAAVVAYLLISRGWAPYAPLPPAFLHGIKAWVVSVDFYALCVLWGATIVALRRSAPLPVAVPPVPG